jgi:hypothetical protein
LTVSTLDPRTVEAARRVLARRSGITPTIIRMPAGCSVARASRCRLSPMRRRRSSRGRPGRSARDAWTMRAILEDALANAARNRLKVDMLIWACVAGGEEHAAATIG